MTTAELDAHIALGVQLAIPKGQSRNSREVLNFLAGWLGRGCPTTAAALEQALQHTREADYALAR